MIGSSALATAKHAPSFMCVLTTQGQRPGDSGRDLNALAFSNTMEAVEIRRRGQPPDLGRQPGLGTGRQRPFGTGSNGTGAEDTPEEDRTDDLDPVRLMNLMRRDVDGM